jgi:hypothetical protein
MTETIAQLQRDIAQMQSIVLYYQNRILRKEIAIAEIIQGNKVDKGCYTEAMKPKHEKDSSSSVLAPDAGRHRHLHPVNGHRNGECQQSS